MAGLPGRFLLEGKDEGGALTKGGGEEGEEEEEKEWSGAGRTRRDIGGLSQGSKKP